VRFAFVPLRLVPAPVFCVMAETALLLALERNEEARAMLDALEGIALRAHLEDLALGIDLWVEQGRVFVRPAGARTPSARVRGNTAAFARLLLGEEMEALVMRREIVADGDGDAMLRMQRWLQLLRPDWERALKDAFGEAVGARVASGLRTLAKAAAATEKQARRWLQGTLRASGVASRSELERLRAGAEHLWHRIDRLQQRLDVLLPEQGAKR